MQCLRKKTLKKWSVIKMPQHKAGSPQPTSCYVCELCGFYFFKVVSLFIHFLKSRFKKFLCIYFGWLGFHRCTSRGCFLVVGCGLLIAEHRALGRVDFSSCGSRAPEHRLSSCGTWASLLHSIWDLLRSGIKPVPPTFAGRFSVAEPPRKPDGS